MAKNKQKPQQKTTQKSVQQEKNEVQSYKSSSVQAVSNFEIKPALAYGILIACTFLSFIGGFGNDFVVWDDPMYVSDNFAMKSPTFANLIEALKVECALNYHPITMASLWLTAFLFGGGDATPFIIVNVILHTINTLLIYKFTTQLTRNNQLVSLLVALLWGVHPMHVESVIWVSERKDVLYTMFFFLSCIQYVKYLEKNERKNLIFCLIFFILSCLSKAMAVVLPLVLLLIDYWFDRGFITKKNIINKIPFFIISLLFGALAVHIQGGGSLGGLIPKMTPEVAISNVISLGNRIKFGFYGFLVYVLKFFIPINQHNFYAYPGTGQYSAIQYVTAPIFALVILGSSVFFYKRKKEVFFGIMFFFVTIVLVLQFLSVGAALLAERYAYIPYFGLLFMVFYFLNEKIQNKNILLSIGVLVSMLFMYLTYKQTLTYKDTGTLFSESYKYEPHSSIVNENLANHFGRTGNIDYVVRYGEFALSQGVTSFSLMGALANAYYLKGNIKKALEFYQKSIDNSTSRKKFIAYYNRGVVNRDIGNFSQSADDFDMVMKLLGDSTRHLPLRAYSRLKANRLQEATADYTKMIKEGISVDTAYNNRAVAKFSLGDREGAITDLKAALKINPKYTEVKNNLERLGIKP
jgi:tetratricopeptide (TPR) repeat protein